MKMLSAADVPCSRHSLVEGNKLWMVWRLAERDGQVVNQGNNGGRQEW